MVQNDETQYIARILDGDTECFSAFLDRYSRPLYVLIVQIVGCSEDAEELVQDVFLKAFRCRGSYRGECRFSTWLYRIAYTTAVSATRKKKQEFLYIEENTINNVPDEKADDILYPTDDEERTARLIQAIDLLNVEEKALITLFYYEEKSIEEIGEVLKLSPGNVKVKLHRTRKNLCIDERKGVMMETNKKHTENALKQALRRRQPGRLPSNFNYRMMEQIRLEAEKQQKRKERVMLCGMIAGILLLLGVGVYTLVFKLEFNFKEYLSGMDFSHADSSLLAFYSYIATLVLLLLGLDYWLRKKKFHS